MMVHMCHPKSPEAEARESEVEGHPPQQSSLEAKLGCVSPYLAVRRRQSHYKALCTE